MVGRDNDLLMTAGRVEAASGIRWDPEHDGGSFVNSTSPPLRLPDQGYCQVIVRLKRIDK